MSNTAGIDDDKVGLTFGCFDLDKSEPFEQFPNLLTFVLIDFTTERVYSKSFHNYGKSYRNYGIMYNC